MYITRGHQGLVGEPGQDLGQPVQPGGDDRGAGGQRLQHHQTEPFQAHRRHQRDVSRPVVERKVLVGHPAHKTHVRPHAQAMSPIGQRSPLRSLAHHHQHQGTIGLPDEIGPGVQQHVEAHPAHQASHYHGRPGVSREPQASPSSTLVTRAEAIDVHARLNDLDPPGGYLVLVSQQRLEGVRHHDHLGGPPIDRRLDVALGHDGRGGAPIESALLGPRAVEVDKEGNPTHHPRKDRDDPVEGEMDVDHLHPPQRAPDGGGQTTQAHGHRLLGAGGDDQPGRGVGVVGVSGLHHFGAHTDPAKGPSQLVHVAVQPPGAGSQGLQPDHHDAERGPAGSPPGPAPATG